MKIKILFAAAIMSVLMCLLAISISAEALADYTDVKLTLVDGTEATGYCPIGAYDSDPQIRINRDIIYKNPSNTEEGTYAWSEIQIFDMRSSTVYGDKTPLAIRGIECNSQAANVTHVYLPEGIKYVLGTSFTDGWKALDTVYISTTVEEIYSNAFAGSPVKAVVFEEGSKCKLIKGRAFYECKKLSYINLEDTSLERIGENSNATNDKDAFRSCISLTTVEFPNTLKLIGWNAFYLSGLSGEIVIPNSVERCLPVLCFPPKLKLWFWVTAWLI